MILEFPSGAKWLVKNESHFLTEKNTSFYSEFNANTEDVIVFEKYRGKKK
jgi:hypothetical protein